MFRNSVFIVFILFLLSGCGTSRRNALKRTGAIQIPSLIDSLSNRDSCVRYVGADYLTLNDLGNWEMYVQGSPEEIGAKIGYLSQDLYQGQEDIFAEKLFELVPSKRRQKLIMRFLKWYNRKLDDHIPDEYLREVFALSSFLDSTYNYLGTPYQRTLWMHGAHDIGHVLQDLAMVGCSSFATWGDNTKDGKLLVGRNLDFYMNDDFAKQKIIYFVKPNMGHPYMSISWPGMVGVLSGMNRAGLTVTLNAGKSTIPWSAKAPISIVAREVLQYATNIDEAIAILEKKKVFVSESMMISSAQDKKAVLVEITPRTMDVVEDTDDRLISTNHFQGEKFKDHKRNKKHIRDSHSMYRFQKLNKLLDSAENLTPKKATAILRDMEGQNGEKLGLGNDKSLNHLLAHHGVIFQPEERLVYISSTPGQMGAYKAYDLNEVFDGNWARGEEYSIDSLRIAADPFILDSQYADFKHFQMLSHSYLKIIGQHGVQVDERELNKYVALNPDLWLGYYIAGRVLLTQGDYTNANVYFTKAASKVLPTLQVQQDIEKQLKKVSKRWKTIQ